MKNNGPGALCIVAIGLIEIALNVHGFLIFSALFIHFCIHNSERESERKRKRERDRDEKRERRGGG